jgi:hypothetical protein
MGDERRILFAHRAGAPSTSAEVVAVPVEDYTRRDFALEGVNPVLGVGGHGTDHGEGLSRGQLGPILS